MKLYLAILSLFVSSVAQADSLAVTDLFEDPAKILLTLFEGAVALTAFPLLSNAYSASISWSFCEKLGSYVDK